MKITASIGLRDSAGREYGRDHVKGLIASRFQGASVVWADGLWEGKWEPCAIIAVICEDDEQAVTISKLREIGHALHQDCILVEANGRQWFENTKGESDG